MKFKTLKYFLFLFILILGLPNALAEENNIVDFNRLGSINFVLKDSTTNTLVPGIEISISKIADIYENNSNINFKYVDNFTCPASLSNLEDKNIHQEILKCVEESKLDNLVNISDEKGIVNFKDINLGLYVVRQTNENNNYSKIEPYLIMLPIVSNNKFVYDIDATPKLGLIRLMDINVKKVWNSSYNKISNEITVLLLNNNQEVDRVILNEENNWSYTFSNLEFSDDYQVLEEDVPTGFVATYQKQDNTFIITNTDTLAQTGFITWKIQVLVVVGIFFILIGILLGKVQNNEKDK